MGDVGGEREGHTRTLFDEFARGDFRPIWFALTTDDFEFVTSPDIPDAGDLLQGRERAASLDNRLGAVAFEESHNGGHGGGEIIDAGGDNVNFAGYLQQRPSEWRAEGGGGGTLVARGDLPGQGAIARVRRTSRHRFWKPSKPPGCRSRRCRRRTSRSSELPSMACERWGTWMHSRERCGPGDHLAAAGGLAVEPGPLT